MQAQDLPPALRQDRPGRTTSPTRDASHRTARQPRLRPASAETEETNWTTLTRTVQVNSSKPR